MSEILYVVVEVAEENVGDDEGVREALRSGAGAGVLQDRSQIRLARSAACCPHVRQQHGVCVCASECVLLLTEHRHILLVVAL